MISQLVSAKPEEMRGYIEEVAGISRYLERKKETESRIKRTKENLSRLDDLREEITRLLFKLQRQAKAAEKYHELRKEETQAQLILLGSKWRDVSSVLMLKEQEVKKQNFELYVNNQMFRKLAIYKRKKWFKQHVLKKMFTILKKRRTRTITSTKQFSESSKSNSNS